MELLAEQTSRAYGHARIRLDPWQGVGLAQRLRDRGVSVEEWSFTSQSVGRLGQNLHLLLRDHRMSQPDDRELLDELQTVRLRESSPGVYRLDHDAGRHDDRALSLGLASLALIESAGSDTGGVWSPVGISRQAIAARAGGAPGMPGQSLLPDAYRLNAPRGLLADLRRAQRAPTASQRAAGGGLIVPGSANEPGRVHRG